MIRRLFSVAAATALMLAPATTHAQAAISITGGVAAPVGRLGDVTDLGYHIAAGLNLGRPGVPFGVRFEGAYEGLGLKGGGGDVRIINGTANGVFNVGPTRDAPYLIGGLGIYNRNVSNSAGNYGNGKTVLGLNAGGGLRFPLSGLTTFFEARYHVMLGNASEGTNYQFIPITFGIMF